MQVVYTIDQTVEAFHCIDEAFAHLEDVATNIDPLAVSEFVCYHEPRCDGVAGFVWITFLDDRPGIQFNVFVHYLN